MQVAISYTAALEPRCSRQDSGTLLLGLSALGIFEYLHNLIVIPLSFGATSTVLSPVLIFDYSPMARTASVIYPATAAISRVQRFAASDVRLESSYRTAVPAG